MRIPFADLLVEELLKLGRFNDIRLKDKIRYIFDNLLLTYSEKELSNFVKYRNIIVHSGISRDFRKLTSEWHNLANLFDRLMLTIFQWKGNYYVDKSKDYIQEILN